MTFRRKPNSEKGGVDGGLRFVVSDGDDGDGALLVSRISEGQYASKAFSEKRLVTRLLADIETLPSDVGRVSSVVDYGAT